VIENGETAGRKRSFTVAEAEQKLKWVVPATTGVVMTLPPQWLDR
jgi:hypothetical protein